MYFETAKSSDELRRNIRTEEYKIETNGKNKVDIKEEMKVEVKQQTWLNEQQQILKDLLERMKKLEMQYSEDRTSYRVCGQYNQFDDRGDQWNN